MLITSVLNVNYFSGIINKQCKSVIGEFIF